MYSLKTCAIGINTSKILYACSIKPLWAFIPGQSRVYFFHSISYLEVIFWPGRLLKITWKFLHIGFWACWLQWWWLELCLTNSLWDKICILLNNGNFANKTLIFGFSYTPLFPLHFALPRWNLILIPIKCHWPSHKKKVQSVKKYGKFSGYFLQV